MNIYGKIVACFLAFLIALFGFSAALCGILSSTFSNPDFMIDVLDKKHYYDSIFTEYCDSIEALAIPSGVDEGVFSTVVTKSEFKNDINNIIRKAYKSDSDYAGNALNYDVVYDRFYACLTQVAENKGVTVDEELIPGLENVSDLCASTYETYVTVPFIDTIGNYASEFNGYFKIGLLVCAALFILLVALMFTLRKWRPFGPYILSISLISVGLMLLAAPLAVMFSGKIRYLNIEIKSLYSFAVGYAENLLMSLVYSGIIILVLGIGVIVLSLILKSRRKPQNQIHEESSH